MALAPVTSLGMYVGGGYALLRNAEPCLLIPMATATERSYVVTRGTLNS
jgi:hypothetical protein